MVASICFRQESEHRLSPRQISIFFWSGSIIQLENDTLLPKRTYILKKEDANTQTGRTYHLLKNKIGIVNEILSLQRLTDIKTLHKCLLD